MDSKAFVVVFFVSIASAYAANILGIFPIHSKSHHSMNQPLMKALAGRGHQVTVLSHFPKANTPNYTDIALDADASGTRSFVDSIDIEEALQMSGVMSVLSHIGEWETTTCLQIFKNPLIKDLIENNNSKVDLIFAEMFNYFCILPIADKLNVPLILLVAPRSVPTIDMLIGNPGTPSYIPSITSGVAHGMSFQERWFNTLEYTLYYVWQHVLFNPAADKIIQEYMGPSTPRVSTLYHRVSLALINSHYTLLPKPTVPNSIDVAGIHLGEPKELPEDIEKFITESEHGVIYFSFGTTIKASSIPEDKLEEIKGALAQVPQRVLWRTDSPDWTELPSNVKASTWFPQREILEHENVVAFISHGGLFGTLEAMYSATPVVGIPFLYDQASDIATLEKLGGGIAVPFKTLTTENLLSAINKVVNETSYAETMKDLSKKIRDRPHPPLDDAVYWTEYVLRHKGAAHMRIWGADMTWYEYLCIDILISVTVAACIFLTILIAVVIAFAKRAGLINPRKKLDPTKKDEEKLDPTKKDEEKLDPTKKDEEKLDPTKKDETNLDPTKKEEKKSDQTKKDE